MDAFTYIDIDRALSGGMEPDGNPSSAGWEEAAQRLLAAVEEMPGPECGECPAWDGLVAAIPVGRADLTYQEQAIRLLDILRLMRAHGPSCNNHTKAASGPFCPQCSSSEVSLRPFDFGVDAETGYHDTGERYSCVNCGSTGEAGELLAALPAPQCAACMCERKDVVSDRLVLGRKDAVCCKAVRNGL
jgi:hypothetical protein